MNDDELDQLLARGRLSGRQYDAIERRVIDRTALRWRQRASLLAAALSVSLCVLWVASTTAEFDTQMLPSSGVRSKGADFDLHQPSALLQLTCDTSSGACGLGDTLMFTVNSVAANGYLVAYAEPVGGGERIWYFPTAEGHAPQLSMSPNTQVLPEGVRLLPPHKPGEYWVTWWLSAAPPSQTLAVAPRGSPQLRLRIAD